jgi:mannitol-specific phosphotransferase system IIBC component
MLDPRWCWALLVLYGFFIRQTRYQGFVIPFISVFIAWSFYALYIDISNQHILANRMSKILQDLPASSLPWLTGVIGGIGGGLSGWVGVNLQKILYP